MVERRRSGRVKKCMVEGVEVVGVWRRWVECGEDGWSVEEGRGCEEVEMGVEVVGVKRCGEVGECGGEGE